MNGKMMGRRVAQRWDCWCCRPAPSNKKYFKRTRKRKEEREWKRDFLD